MEQIQNAERENRIQEIAEKNISFLVEKYGIDEDFLMKRLEKLSVVERKGKTHFVIQNGEKFEILQKYNRVNLVVPVEEKHMYYAAMNSKGCRLTPLGIHYWNLVNKNRI